MDDDEVLILEGEEAAADERPGGDRVTLGITPSGQEYLARVMDTGWFATELDVYKAAVAVGLRECDGEQPPAPTHVRTKYNRGTLDGDGTLRELIKLRYPDTETPYRLAEALADLGLEVLARSIDRGDLIMEAISGARRTEGTE